MIRFEKRFLPERFYGEFLLDIFDYLELRFGGEDFDQNLEIGRGGEGVVQLFTNSFDKLIFLFHRKFLADSGDDFRKLFLLRNCETDRVLRIQSGQFR